MLEKWDSLKLQTLEQEMRFKVGAILLKPDALQLDVWEYIVARISGILHDKGATLEHISTLEVNSHKDMMTIYPDLDEPTRVPMLRYMQSGPCLLVTFRGDGEIDLWGLLKELKGKTMWNWNEEQLLLGGTSSSFIRAMVPVIGTQEIYTPIINKVITKERFDDEEYYYYIQNLIHSPDKLIELLGLLSLIPKEDALIILPQKFHYLLEESI